MGGGSQTSTTVQKADPWKPAQNDLRQGLASIKDRWRLDSTGRNLFAGQDPLQSEALGMAEGMARQGVGTQATGAAQSAVGGLLSDPYGPYADAQNTASSVMNADPYAGAESVYDNITSQVMPRVNATFGGAGRTGSGLHQDTATRAMTEAFSPVAAQLYENDQNRRLAGAGLYGSLADMGAQRMLQGAAVAPSIDAGMYADVDRLSQIGATNRAEKQFEIDRPLMALDQYQNRVRQTAGLGGTTTATGTQPGQSPLQSIAGIGLTGLGLLTGNPMAGFGAAGLLGSLF